ncbi:mitochondrial carrier [Pseudovirgaria hyperparasitica]|uniref:Mitochondrial carrier n=1 Tax=Pseudovirgaria hyperparasitica TaxID=470096 RepID=A0A6A6W227_9PEZI|nr:mitochondrial carrier [Pseudovirgaria hyperparasitica]KAF2756169.1 mitochondrial carrier [Pseudovirgaria hyperparasitica]
MPRVVPPIDGRTSSSNLPPSIIESTAGFSAGVVATLAVHPFDILKTRLQLEIDRKSKPGDSLRVLRQIVRDEGNFKALYRGLMPNMIGNSVSWALYFLWYRNLKDIMQSYRGGERLHSMDYFVASGTSGILTAVCTNPIWVIKTRMISTGANAPGAYKSISDGIRRLYKSEGIPGFWRGLLPSLFGVSHGAIQFVAYEQLKNRRSEYKGSGVELSNWDYLTLSGMSKIFAGSVTYPYQVVRSRLQIYNARELYSGATDVVVQVWRKEGVMGFYKGIIPNIVRVLPSTCVTFLVYENTKYYLPKFWQDDVTLDD